MSFGRFLLHVGASELVDQVDGVLHPLRWYMVQKYRHLSFSWFWRTGLSGNVVRSDLDVGICLVIL